MEQKVRNIAIIAHVDHGKTTLVDKMILVGKVFGDHENPGDLIMDSNDLERERGITIMAKNVSIRYKGYKINIIDTPGHADFGGEVERVLNMADGVLLLVDAFEGPMPQTRFVLQKALQMGLKPIVVVNKVDKENCNPEWVHEQVFYLMCELDANDNQLTFPTLYGSAKQNWMSTDFKNRTTDILPLLDSIIEHIPPPKVSAGSAQLLITSLDYSSYTGRIAIGRLSRGTLTENQQVTLIKRDGTAQRGRVKYLFTFEGLQKLRAASVQAGDICAIFGLDEFDIGDTIADSENPEALPSIAIEEPTMSMLFTINDSPFFGKEGKFVTSRHLKERLEKELEKNLALRLAPAEKGDAWIVYGRGVLHLSILIETMRREGYELQIGQPKVLFKTIDHVTCEPVEVMVIDLPEELSGKAIDLATRRRATLLQMETKGTRSILQFEIPSRGIIGLRNQLLTATQGEAIMTHRLKGYEPFKGEIAGRINGSLIGMESGEAIAYAINNLQDRGTFFVDAGEEIYMGMVVGENNRPGDLVVNLTKTKKLTNMRASGSDDKMRIAPPVRFTLEEALEYIQDDEYVEVTPVSIRLRKVYLDENERKRQSRSIGAMS